MQTARRSTKRKNLGDLADVSIATQSTPLQCASKLGPKRQGEHDAILERLTQSLMHDPELRDGTGLPIPPLLQLISGYAIERYVVSLDVKNKTDLTPSTDDGLWMLHRSERGGYSGPYIYRLGSEPSSYGLNYFAAHSDTDMWPETLCVDESRRRLFFVMMSRNSDDLCIRMMDNGLVTTIVKFDGNTHSLFRMLYSPYGSKDGTIICSDIVDNCIMKVNVTEKRLLLSPIYRQNEQMGGALFWNISPNVIPFTILHFTSDYDDHDGPENAKIVSVDVNTGQLKETYDIRHFRHHIYRRIKITNAMLCTPSGSFLISTVDLSDVVSVSQIWSFDPVTRSCTAIAGSNLPNSSVPNGDPLTETSLREITSIAYLPNEFAVAVSDGDTLFKIPLPAHLCCTPQT